MIVYTHTEGTRDRELVEWDVDEGFDENGSWWGVTGVVQNEVNGRPLAPGTTLRITRSSPIKSINRRTIYTESGSVYKLIGEPNERFRRRLIIMREKYDSENPLSFLRV